MANSATVGTAIIKLSFDGKSVKADINGVTRELETSGANAGSKFGGAWSVAAGNLIANGVSKISHTITNQLDDAIVRADTLTRFPKVMEQMGYSADIAEKSINKLVKGVEKVPTPLDKVVSGTQQLVAVTRDVDKASDWMLAVSDAMLSNSASAEKAEIAVYQFTQVLQKGRPVGDDWRSIMEAAPGVMLELAEAMGYSSAVMGGDFYNALQKGEVSIEEMMDVLVRMDKEGINGMDSLHDRAITASSGIETAMTTMRQSISNAIRDVILDIGVDNITGMIDKIKEALVGLVNVIGSVFSFIKSNWSWIQPILVVVGSVAGTILAIVAALRAWNAIQAAVNAIQLAFNVILNANPIFLLVTVIAAVIAGLVAFFTQTEIGKQIIQSFGEVITSVFGAIGEFISTVWDGIVTGAQAVWNFITGIFQPLAEFFGSIFGGAWERVKAVFSTGGQIFMGIVDGITQAFRKIVNAIITGINHVVAIPFNAINGFLSFLKGIDILGVKPFDWVGTIDVPQIPLLAEGGVAGGATSVVIGEAGKEAVLPLENNTENWAGLLANTLVDEMEREHLGGTGVNIEKQEFIINNQMDAEDIGRVMMQSIRRAA